MPEGPAPEAIRNDLCKVGVFVTGHPVCENFSPLFRIHLRSLKAEKSGRPNNVSGLPVLILIVVRQLELLTLGLHDFVLVEIAEKITHFAGDSSQETAPGFGSGRFVLGFERPVHSGVGLP